MPLLSTNTLFTSDNSIDAGFRDLESKMQKSLQGLAKIRDQLSIEAKPPKSMPVSSEQPVLWQQEKISLETVIREKERTIEQEKLKRELAENRRDELTKQLKTCLTNHAFERQADQDKYNLLKQQQTQLEQQWNQLTKRNEALEVTMQQLETRLQNEVQRKEQCELFLRENAEELKATTEGILERDQKIEELQDNMEHVQRMLEEKDELLEGRVVKAQLDAERYNRLQDKMEQLEKENAMLKQKLLDKESVQSPPETDVTEKRLKDEEKELEITQLRHELLLSQEKLKDRISQYKELESAMERVNEHCNILRNSLNESREESNSRYKKSIGYLEEIRLLKQELNACKKKN
ncbi:hypothetical protein EDC96DRAFT_526632 [Choanephora cucurbitarum]|nr:hypothetical protein EDC96DRAFT_526632 [Choanephora cucurbitarum]